MMSPKQLGRYEILETLGRGAMGIVYKAHDPLIERTVAIKTISYAGLTPDETRDFEQRFFLEAKSAGRLNHHNIVTIHDVGHSAELAYIAMEFLSGQSLRAELDSGVVLPIKRIARIAYSVASGLAFAHTNGVIHRDIKPGNIMVQERGHVKITDFGIALLPSGSLTMAGTAVGSPKYMAPEQVLGQKADCRSDIFSLGAVLYEMLTGTPPFAGDDLNAILYQVLNTAPPLPSSVNASIPPGFDRIVARALAKDPEKRYQSAVGMAADLRNYKRLRGLLSTNQHDTPTTSSGALKPIRSSRSNATPRPVVSKSVPALRWGLIAAAVAVLGGGAYLWKRPSPATPNDILAKDSTIRNVETLPPQAAPRLEAVAPPPKPTVTPDKASPPAPPEAKATEPRKQKQPKKEAETKPQSKPAQPVPGDEEKRPATDWKTQLRNEIAACQSKSFFPRLVCREQARWRHCPGHWGTIEECPRDASSDQ